MAFEHPVTQGSEAWHLLRLGRPTASEFGNLITPEWKPRTGETPDGYLYEKLAEHVLGKPLEAFGAWVTEQGTLLESEAIPFYSFEYDVDIRRVGFVTTDDMKLGCSPDGLIGDDQGIEIKCPRPDTHLKYLLRGDLPPQYRAQVHGAMLVTGRKSWVFMSYCRKLPPFVVVVKRDEIIQAALRSVLDAFLAKFEAQVAAVEAMQRADAKK